MQLFTSVWPALPQLSFRPHRALDLGCGKHSIFADVDIADVKVCADPFPADGSVVACKGERLPFANSSFDLVVSRVAIPYMHIPRALREIRRVLSPGGCLWATLHHRAMAIERIAKGNPRDAIYQSCAILNGVLLYFTDAQIPWTKGRIESIQMPGAFRNALVRAGFQRIETEIIQNRPCPYFGVRAFKS
jgi:ubiquinone/menaquinone biosynthesis C-methylase UbiE